MREEYINDRRIAVKVLVGSHNYNLDTPESDKDYKYFVYPTFDDLYNNRYFHSQQISAVVDYEVHDVRRLAELFMKSNPNYLEVLYSTEYEWHDDGLHEFLMKHRGTISTMNLPRLWSSLYGLGIEKESKLLKGTGSTQQLVDKYGYDTKQAMHAARAYLFIGKLANVEFDFGKAIWTSDEGKKDYIKIKRGQYSYKEMKGMLKKYADQAKTYEHLFKAQPVNKDMEAKLQTFVYTSVYNDLIRHKDETACLVE